MTEQAKSRILIVEDESIVAMDIQRRLERLGYGVAGIAISGEEAVEAAGRLAPDLVLMDIKLKGDMDGTQAAGQIRDRFNIPVIYLTAYTDDATLEFAKITEPYGYIVKPFGDRELHSTIDMALYKHQAEMALRKSEEKYRLFYEDAPLGYQSLDASGNFLDVNKEWLNILGYSKEEVIGRFFADFVVPESLETFTEDFSRFKAGGKTRGTEFEMLRKDGSRITVSFNGNIEYDKEGRFRRTHCIMHDVTERKKAEQAIQTLTESIAGTTGQEAFDKIVTNLCKWLDVEFAIVGQVVKEEQVNVLSMYSEGEIIHDYSYGLAGSPCGYVVQKGYCVYPENVRRQFPEDKDLVELKAEGYVGTALRDRKGRAIGVLCAISRQKLNLPKETEQIMRILATKASSEIERKKTEETLRLTQFSVDNSTDAVYWMGPDARFIYVNNAAVEALGYSEEEMLTMTVHDIGPEFPVEAWPAHWAELKEKKSFVIHTIHQRKDESTFPVEITVNFIQFGGREINCAIAKDITERKRVEENSRKQQYYLAKAQEIGSIGTWELDIQKNILVWTEENYRVFGVPLGTELNYEIFLSYVHPDDRDYVHERWSAALDHEPYDIEHRLIVDGQVRWVREKAEVIFDEAGKAVRGIGFTQDITLFKQAEMALRDSEEKYKSLFENMQNGFALHEMVFDEAGAPIDYIFLDVNETFEKQTNLERKDLIGRKVTEALPGIENDPADWISTYGEVVLTGNSISFENYSESLKKWYSVVAYRPNEGQFAVIFLDITERKRAEEALRESEERLELFFSQSLDGFFFMMLDEPVRWDDTVDKEKTLDYVFAHQRMTKVNDALFRQYGASREQFVGLTPNELYAHDVAYGRKIWRDFFDGGRLHIETDERKLDGTPIWVEGDYICLYDSEGRITGHFGIQRDVSNRKQAEESLQRSANLLKESQAVARLGHYDFDARTGLWESSEILDEIFGIGGDYPKNMEGWLQIVHPDQRSEMSAYMSEVVLGQDLSFDREYRITRVSDQQVRWVHGLGRLEFEEEGKPVRMIGTIQDVTDRKNAQEALQKSEEKFRILTQESPVSVYQTDKKGKCIFANPNWYKMSGLTEEEAMGDGWAKALHEDDRELVFQSWNKMVESEGKWGLEYRFKNREGKVTWVYGTTSPIYDEDGEISGYVGINTDITERKQAEEAVRKSEEKYRSLIANIPDVVWTADQNGKFTFVSQNVKDICGYNPEEIYAEQNHFWFGKIHPDDIERVTNAEARLLGEGTPLDVEYRIQKKSGEWIWLQDRSTGTYEKDGVKYADGVFVDITERKQAEDARLESEEQYRSLYESVHAGIILQSVDGEIIHANKVASQIFGMATDQIIGKNSTDPAWRVIMEDGTPVPGEEHPSMITIRTGKPVRDAVRGLFADDPKNIRWLHINTEPLLNPATGKMEKVMITFHDITERKNAEEQLRRESVLRNTLLDNLPCVAMILKKQTREIVASNEAARKAGAVPGKICYEICAERDNPCPFCLAPEAWATNEPRRLEVEYKERYYEGIWVPLTEELYVHYIFDITERKNSEERLRESEERLTKAFQASPNLMGIIDLDERRRLLVNEAFARITGYSKEELAGTTFDELNFWVEPDRVHEAIRFARQDEVLQDYEADIRTKQGEIRTLRYHGALLDIPGKNVVMLSAEDITEQREAERRIKEYQAQLKSLASELSLAEERERRRIATGIHDNIAQKLAMAKFELQSLQVSITDNDVSESLGKQCQLMDQVVADARSLTFELSNPVLYQVGLEAAIESYLTERIQGQFGLKCKFKSEGPRSSLEEDIRVVLFQAVRELLVNIVKHASASTVEVCVSNTEDRLRIVVQDDGVGFDPTEIGPHLTGRGGFGLFNIRERLEYLGGNVKIESKRKKGARITMTVAMRTDAVAE